MTQGVAIRPSGRVIGAEVQGVDLAQPFAPEVVCHTARPPRATLLYAIEVPMEQGMA
jgi:hypothetical protein